VLERSKRAVGTGGKKVNGYLLPLPSPEMEPLEVNVIAGLLASLVVGLAMIALTRPVQVNVTLTQPVRLIMEYEVQQQFDEEVEPVKADEVEVQEAEAEAEAEAQTQEKPPRPNPILKWNLYVNEVFNEMATELGIHRAEYSSQKDYIADCKEFGLTRKDATEEAQARKAASK
jgi:hypothetical protein